MRAGVLTMEEVEQVIGIEFNPVRCGFAGGEDVWLTDVLKLMFLRSLLSSKVSHKRRGYYRHECVRF